MSSIPESSGAGNPPANISIEYWDGVDKSDWPQLTDAEVAARHGISKSQARYWRKKCRIPTHTQYWEALRKEKYQDGLHYCGHCEEFLPIENFGRSERGWFGLRSRCKKCRRRIRGENRDEINRRKRERYEREREKILKRNARWRKNNRDKFLGYLKDRQARLKRKYVARGGGECQRCGYSEYDSALSFHHVDPREKDESPSNVIYSGDEKRTEEELDKCVLLCLNCHSSLHADEWEAEFVERDGMGWTIA